MFVVVAFFEGRREHRGALGEALKHLARQVGEHEPRCHRLDVSVDRVDDASYLVYAHFEDEAAYKAHQESRHYSDFSILVAPWVSAKRVLTYALLAETTPSTPPPVAPTHPAGHA